MLLVSFLLVNIIFNLLSYISININKFENFVNRNEVYIFIN